MDIQRNPNIGSDFSIKKNKTGAKKEEVKNQEAKTGDLSAQLDSMAASQRALLKSPSFRGGWRPEHMDCLPTDPSWPNGIDPHITIDPYTDIDHDIARRLNEKYFAGDYRHNNGIHALSNAGVNLAHAIELGYNLQEIADMSNSRAKILLRKDPQLLDVPQKTDFSAVEHASLILNMDLNEIAKLGYDLKELSEVEAEHLYDLMDDDQELMKLFVKSNINTEKYESNYGQKQLDRLLEGTMEEFWQAISEKPYVLHCHRTEKASFSEIAEGPIFIDKNQTNIPKDIETILLSPPQP